MKKLSAIAALLLGTTLACPAFAAPCDDFPKTMTQRAVGIIHDHAQSEQQKRVSLSALFQEAVDTDWIAKFVLGHYWNDLKAEEQKSYMQDYRNYVTHNYISKFSDDDADDITDIQVVEVKPQAEAGQYQAKTLVLSKTDPSVHVDYLLDGNGPKCRVHDIVVEGISLLTSQRSEFQTLAASSGVAGIMAAMDKQLAQ